MILKQAIQASLALALSLAATACMKPGQEATGMDSSDDPKARLDATHGGARISLPEIDFAALGKIGKDTVSSDTATQAFFELTITGANMSELFFQYPLKKKSGSTFEIKGIPSGSKRSFHGRLLNRGYQLTHEGVTVADIKSGTLTDIRLYLSKAGGSANVCVVIEGQKLPACALDTIPPPPPPDTAALSSCWYVSSDSVSGQMSLYPQYVSGYMGKIATANGVNLPITAWKRLGDSLTVIVVRPSGDKKWLLSGPVTGGNALWTATGVGGPMESPFLLYGKALPCGDTVIVPPKDTLPPVDTLPPPKDTVKVGAIPSAASSAGEVTLCFEMRFNYDGKCELSGYAKMGFFAGQVTRGNITVADKPARDYHNTSGDYSQSPNQIHIQTYRTIAEPFSIDTLVLDGNISSERTMVKGEYLRLPAEKKGIWTMTSVPCGSWTPKYPDSTCFAPPEPEPPVDPSPIQSLKGKATASAVWENNPLLQPENVQDGTTFDTANAGNYWDLPNNTKGWVQIDLGKDHKLSHINLFNTSNSYCNDRGTKDFRLEIRDEANAVILTTKGVLPFVDYFADADAKTPFSVKFKEAVRGRYVKVYVDSWYRTRTDASWPYQTCYSSNLSNEGGGLNEVQIFGTP